jgi:RimJ/RimL family protein N-acetyltransferase
MPTAPEPQPLPAPGHPRVRLQPLDDTDGALYVALYTDAVVLAHVMPPLSLPVAQRSFAAACRQARQPAPARRYWTIRGRDGGEAMGLLGLVSGPRQGLAEVGILLVPEWQRRGVAREAVAMLVAQMFSAGTLESIEARHAPGNRAAARLFDSLGFRAIAGANDVAQRTWRLARGDARDSPDNPAPNPLT